jgi:hypothetical protein
VTHTGTQLLLNDLCFRSQPHEATGRALQLFTPCCTLVTAYTCHHVGATDVHIVNPKEELHSSRHTVYGVSQQPLRSNVDSHDMWQCAPEIYGYPVWHDSQHSNRKASTSSLTRSGHMSKPEQISEASTAVQTITMLLEF